MLDKVNLAEKLALFDKAFSPKIVGEMNEYKIQVVKARGEFVWHSHPDTDDFFLVLKGRLSIQLRDRVIELSEGELFVVPRGVEHCPQAEDEAHVLLIEPTGTPNTGDAGGELTARGSESKSSRRRALGTQRRGPRRLPVRRAAGCPYPAVTVR
jgi:mannose-6-phosphate isomerase-like protein (cupin superfamily)